MPNNFDFSASALVGHFVSVTLLAKLVDRNVISVEDAIEVLDEVLLQLEEWQSSFPDRESFEGARDFLSISLDGYRTMLKERRG
jgi:hypothetical protein